MEEEEKITEQKETWSRGHALALSEASSNLTRALEALEDVPREAFAHPEDCLRLQELIAQAGQIVASELARGDE